MPIDTSRRFLFEHADIRGETVRLEESYAEILAIHQYAPGVGRILGEFLAASVLLSTTLKFEGKLVLQARSEGEIPLLMAECDDRLHVRGIARGAEQATASDNERLLTNGHLVITIDPVAGQRYQGIVPLAGGTLSHSLDSYFAQSEQLGTRVWLAADGARAGGLLLQQLPAQVVQNTDERARQWEHACTLAATIRGDELMTLPAKELLHRLFNEDLVRLFEPRSVRFACSCSTERTRNALLSLGREEVEDLLREMGVITMDCEFCNQQYRFAKDDLTELLADTESKTLH